MSKPHGSVDVSQAKEKLVTANNIALLITLWFAIGFTMYVQQFVLMGWAKLILGAKEWDWQTQWDVLSIPLGWFDGFFVIQPEYGFFHVTFIIFANSYVWAAVIFPILRFVQKRLRANSTVQLGLHSEVIEMDSELLDDTNEGPSGQL